MVDGEELFHVSGWLIPMGWVFTHFEAELRRAPSGHRILSLLSLGQYTASRFHHAIAGDTFV